MKEQLDANFVSMKMWKPGKEKLVLDENHKERQTRMYLGYSVFQRHDQSLIRLLLVGQVL